MGFKYQTFILPYAEYAKICSEINTYYYAKYKDKELAVHMSYGVDANAYWYFFENHGYNNYNIYMRVKV